MSSEHDQPRGVWRVAVMPGDGIGPEVMAAATSALGALTASGALRLEIEELAWPSHAYHRAHGRMMPADWKRRLALFDVLLLGALGDPGPADEPGRHLLPDAVSLAPLLAMRRELDLWACERPATLLPGAHQHLADPRAAEVDLLVVRENSEGEYAGLGGRLHRGTPEEVAVQTGLFTRRGTERILRHAFERARLRAIRRGPGGRSPEVCLITKRNALAHWGELYTEVFAEVAADFPEIGTRHELFDAACMKFVTEPWQLDVVVASNLQGDVLTDLAAVLCGGLGVAPSCNLSPHDRRRPPLFEPTHGSAPDIAGRGVASPTAMLLTCALMLEWMSEEDPAAAGAARRLRRAVEDDLSAHTGARRSTADVAASVVARLSRPEETRP